MQEIARPTKIRQSGARALLVGMPNAASVVAGISGSNAVNVFIDGEDMVVSADTKGPGTHLGLYSRNVDGYITVPAAWRDKVSAVPGTQVLRFLDTYKGRPVLRIRKA